MSWWWVPDRCCCDGTTCSCCEQYMSQQDSTILRLRGSNAGLSFEKMLTGGFGQGFLTTCCQGWSGQIFQQLYGCQGGPSMQLSAGFDLCCPNSGTAPGECTNFLLYYRWWALACENTAAGVASPTSCSCNPFVLNFIIPGPPYSASAPDGCRGCISWQSNVNIQITKP